MLESSFTLPVEFARLALTSERQLILNLRSAGVKASLGPGSYSYSYEPQCIFGNWTSSLKLECVCSPGWHDILLSPYLCAWPSPLSVPDDTPTDTMALKEQQALLNNMIAELMNEPKALKIGRDLAQAISILTALLFLIGVLAITFAKDPKSITVCQLCLYLVQAVCCCCSCCVCLLRCCRKKST